MIALASMSSFNKYLWRRSHMPDTLLGSWDPAVNRMRSLLPKTSYSSVKAGKKKAIYDSMDFVYRYNYVSMVTCIILYTWNTNLHLQLCVPNLYNWLPAEYLWASLVAQTVKNLPAMGESWVRSLGREDPLEDDMAAHSSILSWRIPMDRGAEWATVHRVTKNRTCDWAQSSTT